MSGDRVELRRKRGKDNMEWDAVEPHSAMTHEQTPKVTKGVSGAEVQGKEF
jgi:hypothetical protein